MVADFDETFNYYVYATGGETACAQLVGCGVSKEFGPKKSVLNAVSQATIIVGQTGSSICR